MISSERLTEFLFEYRGIIPKDYVHLLAFSTSVALFSIVLCMQFDICFLALHLTVDVNGSS
jgi:hypothetical protein